MTFFPTNELVCVTWLRARTPLLAAQVATSLPEPVAGVLPWQDSGFVTVRTLSTGLTASSMSLPSRSPIVTIDCWAAPARGSNKPRWNLAGQLAEIIWHSTMNDVQSFGKNIDLGANYQTARVLSVYMATEPRRVEDDPNAYARFTFDIIVDWVIA